MTQSAVILVFRSNKLPFYHTYPSMPVVLSLIIVSLIGFILVLVPGLQPIFSSLTQGDGLKFFGISFGIVGGYILSAQLAKMAYIKLFHH
jgi:Mg2+-importing ATPase